MCYCIDRKLVIVNSEIELQFIPPTTIRAECTHDLNPSIQDSWGLIYNYNKIWVRAAVWVRKWIDGSDQVSESLLTTRDGAISRLGITWGVESGVISWTQRRLSNHCIKPPYSRTWAIKDHGNLFHRNTPQFTPMSEPVLWCNVQSAVLPGICGLDWLLRRDHSLPQSSEELVTVNKAVMVYTNSARYHQCEPSYEMYL